MVILTKKPSHSWWFDSHNNPRNSQWLQSTLSELDEKTEAMLKLIEEDADSFAQRAEIYYQKRPELIKMVEDFYRAHRSLAERFDQLKSDNGTRLCTQLGSPLRSINRLQSSMSPVEESYDSYSETFESEESEVDDPEPEKKGQIGTREVGVATEDNDSEEMKDLRGELETLEEENRIQKAQLMEKEEEMKVLRGEMERLEEENRIQKAQLMEKDEEMKVLGGEMARLEEENRIQKAQLMGKDEEMKVLGGEMERLEEEKRIQKAQLMEKDEEMKVLGGEMERLEEENRIQKAQLMEKDEEKREVIRQLSLALEFLKEENVELKKRFAKEEESRKRAPFDLNKLKEGFMGKLFSGSSPVFCRHRRLEPNINTTSIQIC